MLSLQTIGDSGSSTYLDTGARRWHPWLPGHFTPRPRGPDPMSELGKLTETVVFTPEDLRVIQERLDIIRASWTTVITWTLRWHVRDVQLVRHVDGCAVYTIQRFRPSKLECGYVYGVPDHLHAEDKRALLNWQHCNMSIMTMWRAVADLLDGTPDRACNPAGCADADVRAEFLLRDSLTVIVLAPEALRRRRDFMVWGLNEEYYTPPHTVLGMQLRNGSRWILDLSNPQYGFSRDFLPESAYRRKQVRDWSLVEIWDLSNMDFDTLGYWKSGGPPPTERPLGDFSDYEARCDDYYVRLATYVRELMAIWIARYKAAPPSTLSTVDLITTLQKQVTAVIIHYNVDWRRAAPDGDWDDVPPDDPEFSRVIHLR